MSNDATPQSPTPATQFERNYRALSKAVIDSMRELGKIVDTGLSTFLLILGTVVLFMAILLKLQIEILGIHVLGLQPVEFIALLVFSAAILATGTLIRWRQIQTVNANFDHFRELNFRSLEAANAVAAHDPDATHQV